MEEKQGENNRFLYFDLLRIVACFSVIVLHVSAQYWYYLPVNSGKWLVCNIYDALFRFGVPVFVMISGALFLGRDKENSVRHLFLNNILRLVIVYIVWSVIYAAWFLRDTENVDLYTFFRITVESKYHLWFLPMLVQIYVLIPFLKAAVQKGGEKVLRYAVFLFVCLCIVPATLREFTFSPELTRILNLIHLDFLGNYVGYFLMGCYLYRYPPQKKYRKWIYLSGVLGATGAVTGSIVLSRRHGVPESGLFDSFSVFTFLVTCAIFVFFTSMREFRRDTKIAKGITNLSKDTFGIYLVHVLIIEFMFARGIDSESFINVLSIPALSLLWFMIGAVIAGIFRRIPIVGKYIC